MSLLSEHLNNARKHDDAAILVSECERIISQGLLPEYREQRLRELANNVCNSFGMNSIAERVVQVGDHQPELVRA